MSATVTLQHPVKVQGQDYTSLTMRRPKVKDEKAARRAGKDPADHEVRLIANLCEVVPDVIEELDLADYKAVQDAYRGFFPEADAPD